MGNNKTIGFSRNEFSSSIILYTLYNFICLLIFDLEIYKIQHDDCLFFNYIIFSIPIRKGYLFFTFLFSKDQNSYIAFFVFFFFFVSLPSE